MAAQCERCGKSSSWLNPLANGKICNNCWADDRPLREAEAERQKQEKAALKAAEQAQRAVEEEAVKLRSEAASRVVVTTEVTHNLAVSQRLGIVSAEVVFGMHLLKDVAAEVRDLVGGRSKVMQKGLREARVTATGELQDEAFLLGADAVVGTAFSISESRGGMGTTMIYLVATGTAVKLAAH